MAFEMTHTYSVDVYLDELYQDDEEFILDFSIHPYIIYDGKTYEYVGIKESIFYKTTETKLADWKTNYMDKLEFLTLAYYDDRDECVQYSGPEIRDIKDKYLRENLLKEVKKALIKAHI